MGICIALLRGPLEPKGMAHWTNTEFFEERIIHVQELTGVDPSGTELIADPFVLPDDFDVKEAAGGVLIDCSTGEVATQYGFQVPLFGLSIDKTGTIMFCLRGWELGAQTIAQIYESNCDILADPCAVYKELRCCLYKLVKDQECVSIQFRDRAARFQPRSEGDKLRLERMVMEAKAECECNTEYRGGDMGHSCAHSGGFGFGLKNR